MVTSNDALQTIAKNAKTTKTLKFVVRELKIRMKKHKKAGMSKSAMHAEYKKVIDAVNQRTKELK